MNVNSNAQMDISCSDNSHIFGIPFVVCEGYDADMDIPIIINGERSFEMLGDWIERVRFLEEAGIEFRLHYKGEE